MGFILLPVCKGALKILCEKNEWNSGGNWTLGPSEKTRKGESRLLAVSSPQRATDDAYISAALH
jgi:hypothetical protein